MKILIIRFHSISKIFASIALVKAIKNKYSDAIIHFVSTTDYQSYLSKFSEIEKLFFVEGDITPTVLALLKEKYSHTIDLQGNARSRFITSHLGQQFNSILTKYSYPKGLWKQLFNKKYYQVKDLTTQFIKCTNDLKLSTSNLRWYYPTNSVDELQKNDLPVSHSLGYYCIDIINVNKDNIIEVISKINFPVVLLGGKLDADKAIQIQEQDPIKIYNACGKFTIGEQCNILKGSKLNIIHTEIIGALSATLPISVINTSNEIYCLEELESFTSKSIARYQTALWVDENDMIARIKSIL